MSTWEPSDKSPFSPRPYWQADDDCALLVKPARWRSWRLVEWLFRGYAFCLVRGWHLRRRLRAATCDRFDAWRHARWIDGDFAGLRAVLRSSVYSSLIAAVTISWGLVLGSRLNGRSWMLEYFWVPLLLDIIVILVSISGFFLLKESVCEYGRRYTLYRISDPGEVEGPE